MDILPGFASLAARYDGFILDLWGVIHDGQTPYPGAVEVLTRLQQTGRRVALLSNAPRRSDTVTTLMQGMGIPDRLYNVAITSGEITRRMLAERTDPFFAALGPRVYHLGPERDRSVLEGLEARYTRVDSPEKADFVLDTGYDDAAPAVDAAARDAELAACRAAGLPMVCANPDLVVVRRDGTRLYCAGTLAQRYEAQGGAVRWIGKPDPTVYGPVVALLGTAPERTLCVGDSLRTDMDGARRAGLAGAWILGGIHAEALEASPFGRDAAARQQAAEARLDPVAAVPFFSW